MRVFSHTKMSYFHFRIGYGRKNLPEGIERLEAVLRREAGNR
jgi:hypothetical protein